MLDHAGLFEKFLRILSGGFFHFKHVLYTCYKSKFRKLQEFSEIVLGLWVNCYSTFIVTKLKYLETIRYYPLVLRLWV